MSSWQLQILTCESSLGDLTMSESTKLDDIRRAALHSVEASRRQWARALSWFAVAESVCWVAYILFAFLGFPASVLIGVAALLVYSTVFASIMGLRLHLDNCTQSILKAIETLARETPDEENTPGSTFGN
jgi:hypothetical protein